MVQTVRKTHSRTPNFRCGMGSRYRKSAVNALLTGPFYYSNPCIKNVVLIDPTSGSGSLLINIGAAASKYITGEKKINYYAQELKGKHL